MTGRYSPVSPMPVYTEKITPVLQLQQVLGNIKLVLLTIRLKAGQRRGEHTSVNKKKKINKKVYLCCDKLHVTKPNKVEAR